MKKIAELFNKYKSILNLVVSFIWFFVLLFPILIINEKQSFIFTKAAFSKDRFIWFGLFLLSLVTIGLGFANHFLKENPYKEAIKFLSFFSFLTAMFFSLVAKSYDKKIHLAAFILLLIIFIMGTAINYFSIEYFKKVREQEAKELEQKKKNKK